MAEHCNNMVPESKHSILTIWWTSLGHFNIHFIFAVFYLLLPIVKSHFQFSYTQMGGLVTAVQFVGILVNFPGGAAVDIFRKRNVFMATSLSIVGIAYTLFALSNTYVVFILLTSMAGIGIYLWHPPSISMLHDYYQDTRGWAIGWHASAANMGDALGPVIAGWLLIWYSWRVTLAVSATPAIFVGTAIFWVLAASERHLSSGEPNSEYTGFDLKIMLKTYLSGLLELVQNRSVLLLTLATGFRAMTQTALQTFLPALFMNVWALSPLIAGSGIAVMEIAGTVAAPVSGKISDHYGRKKVARIGLFLSAVSIILIANIGISTWLLAILGMLGFFLYALRPVFIAWAMEMAPQQGYAGSVVALTFTFQSILSAIAPLLGGWIADKWGLIYTFYLIAASIIAAEFIVTPVKEPLKVKITRQ